MGRAAWFWDFLKHELAPYPGRAMTMARMVLAATLVMIICYTFRIPYAFVGGIYALLIARESPRVTVMSAGMVLLLASGGLAYMLVSVQFVVSIPPLHFLWVVCTLFLTFYTLKVLTNYKASVALSLVVAIAITIWDRHVSAETNVEDTLRLSLVALIAVVVTSGVELVFRHSQPGDDIVEPIADRLAAVHSVLLCYAEGRPADQVTEEKLIHVGMLGTSALRRTLWRSDYSLQYKAQMSSVVALVGTLVDLTTALTHLTLEPSSMDREHLRNVAVAVKGIRGDLIRRRIPPSIQVSTEDQLHSVPLLREMENTVALIPEAFVGSPSIDEMPGSNPVSRLLVEDAFTNIEHFKFALKGCFAVSACYVIYNAIDWPGMGVTVMLTCFFTALSTIGASRQKQLLRFAGFVVGGFVFGMGSQVFVLPYLDSIAGFTVLFVLVTAVAAWFLTSSPRLSFFGLQLGAVFFVIHMQNFAEQTSLAIARDRVAGVCLGLFMMWLIFDQLWSAPASIQMERTFVATLRLLAQLTREPASPLRDTISAKFDIVRSLADAVLLEFGASRPRDLALRASIRKWQPQLRALFLMRGAFLKDHLSLPDAAIVSLQAYNEYSAQMLENIADRMEGKTSQGRPAPGNSLALLEQMLSQHAATFIPLLREIDRLTNRLADQMS